MEKLNSIAAADAAVTRGGGTVEESLIHGKYEVQCFGADGALKWEDAIDNVVTTVGKNLLLDAGFAPGSFTTVGPFLGLISSVSWSTVAVGDTMGSHAGWLEAGTTNAPQWTTPASGARATPTMASAGSGSKAFSSAVSFSISTSGTIKGCFLVFGSGAVVTNLSTAGTLYSAGTFASDKVVSNGDTLSVNYSTSL